MSQGEKKALFCFAFVNLCVVIVHILNLDVIGENFTGDEPGKEKNTWQV